MAKDPYRYFRVEAKELLEQLGRGALDLEKGPATAERVAQLLRAAHTLKGAARVVRLSEVAEAAHGIEDALAPFRAGAPSCPKETIDRLLAMLDGVSHRLDSLGPVEPPPLAGEASQRTLVDDGRRTVRAEVAEVDGLLDGIGEVQVRFSSLRQHLASLEKSQRQVEASWRASLRSVMSDCEQLDRELQEVREVAERLRLVPAGALFSPLERTARDISTRQSKRIAFEAKGGEVRLDAHLFDLAQAALVQLVRNAVAHGIETEAERLAAGKPKEGRVTLEVLRRGNQVVFVCSDDGRGVDLAAVRQVAQRKGLLPKSDEPRGPEELLRLLLKGGISTSAVVTEVAGRGVGLDVVREAADRLGGDVVVRTQHHVGTTVELLLPASLSALPALLLETQGERAALPADCVEKALHVPAADLMSAPGGESLVVDGCPLPFVSLSRVLRRRSENARRTWSVVVVRSAHERVAVGADRVLGMKDVVLRPLPSLAAAQGVVAGASLDELGNPQLVLDPEQLVDAAKRAAKGIFEGARARPVVLVVDDSLTTRMLEQSILESAGYEVELATSGEEALEKARAKRYGLCLVDVEMPGMDGFELLRRMQGDAELREVPSILVTSRGSAEDRRRGVEVGARGYIVKSEFDQAELLERIRALVG